MIKRNYKIRFKICINEKNLKPSSNAFKYYIPKWSYFMKLIMSRKLSHYNNNKTASFKELPLLRKVVTSDIKTENIVPLLEKYDKELSRLLLEVAPFFDATPNDLKCHILAVFGITANDLELYLDNISS